MKNDARPYLTLPFYLECERLFDQAETQCASNPKALLHVRRERIPVDSGLFHMWSQLTRDLPAGTGLLLAIVAGVAAGSLRERRVRS